MLHFQSPEFTAVVGYAHNRARRFKVAAYGEYSPRVLRDTLMSEVWLAMHTGDQPVNPRQAAREASAALRRQTRQRQAAVLPVWRTKDMDSSEGDPTDTYVSVLTASHYVDTLRQFCTPDEWALLQARCVDQAPFEEIAYASGHTTPMAQRREATRLRKQLQRLRQRCQDELVRTHPHIREDL